ncbi:hypothetical protein M0Q50_10335 [bacterium]|jgi:predicted site-specific integrase-resolvase|nr:hypothetical protein [bacterium]
MEETWYTYKEIINKFDICKQTLNNWRKNGNIIYKKITNRKFMYKIPENIIENNSNINI